MIQIPTQTECPPPELVGEHTIPTNNVPVSPSRWRRPKKVVWVPLILLGIILGAALFGPFHWASSIQERLGSSSALTSTGELGILQAPTYNLQFSSAVTGAVSDIYVDLGQHVVTNQILARLGQNTFVAQVHEAQVAVDSDFKVVVEDQRFVSLALRNVHAQVVLAAVTFRAAIDNRQALIRQANANIAFAKTKLATDEATLRAVTEAAEATIKSAKATLKAALEACQMAVVTPPTTTSASTLSRCVQAAEATFRTAVAAADATVVTAQGTVRQDQEALEQAFANANVNLVAQNGLIREAAAGITVAETNTIAAVAIRDLAVAESVYRVALAALLVAQEALDLTILRAPHSGYVSAIIGTIGGQPGALNNFVPAGGVEMQSEHGGLTFIQLVDLDNLNSVLTWVTEREIQKIHLGEEGTFTLYANRSLHFTGTVHSIGPNGIAFPSTNAENFAAETRFPVIFAIGNQSHRGLNLYSGMTGRVIFTP
ncbi:hypothetical protein ccbrp13_37790 [Ktedonobacteria bacterium brp13]|nr:hypothetical protein ccbrp13_37790 [Ktedonobacteria bacterium brp13]